MSNNLPELWRREHTDTIEELPTGCDRFYQKALLMDLYQEPFRLLLPDNRDAHRTVLGSCLSLVTLTIMLIYGVYSLIELQQK